MNATKFVVLLIFLGVVCANVGAKKLEKVSKETKLGISVSNTATTNGLGAELDVSGATGAFNSEYSRAGAAAGPEGPSSDGSASVYKSSTGNVNAEGPNASGSSNSYAFGNTGAFSAADPNGASTVVFANGGAGSSADGSTPNP